MTETVRVRFAPSPTGFLHIGGVRTALFNWLYARNRQGTFVLRIEDTDASRSTEDSIKEILEAMAWLGLDWDEGPYRQTERQATYNAHIQAMLDNGHAYRCYCTPERVEQLRKDLQAQGKNPKYDGLCRNRDDQPDAPHVIRLKAPLEGATVFDDLLRGKVSWDNSELDDFVLQRTDGSPTYNLSVVVDDYDMGITQVIRGDDHINNTPRQINMFRAMGWPVPDFAHVPMILGDDGARLSKRHGAVSVMQYKEDGFLPEALLNYLVRLGWSHGDQEIFSRAEMVEYFDLGAVNRAPSAFNTEKLIWVNQQYIKTADPARLAVLVGAFLDAEGVATAQGADLASVIEAQRERAGTLVELAALCRFYYQDFEEFEPAAARKALKDGADNALGGVRSKLDALPDWERAAIHDAIAQTVDELGVGFGKVAMPLRVAVTGGAPSPDLDLTISLVGRDATLRRIDRAVSYIRSKG